jgi:hypothetical protein
VRNAKWLLSGLLIATVPNVALAAGSSDHTVVVTNITKQAVDSVNMIYSGTGLISKVVVVSPAPPALLKVRGGTIFLHWSTAIAPGGQIKYTMSTQIPFPCFEPGPPSNSRFLHGRTDLPMPGTAVSGVARGPICPNGK